MVAVYNSGELVYYPSTGSGTFFSARLIGNAPGFRLMSLIRQRHLSGPE
jgi:hypothetical protein